MNKAQRRMIHTAINDLTNDQVAAIVRQSFPRVRTARWDQMAKAVIANAHRQVSPRLPRRTR